MISYRVVLLYHTIRYHIISHHLLLYYIIYHSSSRLHTILPLQDKRRRPSGGIAAKHCARELKAGRAEASEANNELRYIQNMFRQIY